MRTRPRLMMMNADDMRTVIEQFAVGRSERFAYSVGRRSEYITWFPVRAILDALTLEEGDGHTWGGADNVGGSPRSGGSRLTPTEVEAVVARVVVAHRP